ncbi:MAG: zinc-ribbon domain-containing protein [Pseudomonadota bacterium]
MKITCKNCFATYNLDETKIKTDEIKVRCSKCNYSFTVSPNAKPETKPPTVAKPKIKSELKEDIPQNTEEDDDNKQLLVRLASGQTYEVDDHDTLKNWIKENRLTPDDELSITGGRFLRIGDLSEFQELFGVDSGPETTDRYEKPPKLEDDDFSPTQTEDSPSVRDDFPSMPHIPGAFDTNQPTFKGELKFDSPQSPSQVVRTEAGREDTYVKAKSETKKKSKSRLKITIPIILILIIAAVLAKNPHYLEQASKIIKRYVSGDKYELDKAKLAQEELAKEAIEAAQPPKPEYLDNPNYVKAIRLFKYDLTEGYELAKKEIENLLYSFNEPELYGAMALNLALYGYRQKDEKLLVSAMEYANSNLAVEGSTKADAYKALAVYYLAKGNLPLYSKRTEEYLNNIPANVESDHLWGLYYKKKNILKEAEVRFVQASQKDAELMLPRRELLEIAQLRKEENMANLYTQEIEKNKTLLIMDYPDLGTALNKKEEPKPVVKEEKIVKKIIPKPKPKPIPKPKPLTAQDHFNTGRDFYKKGEFQKAFDSFSQAIKIGANNPIYHYYTGITYQELYQTEKAVEEYKKAISLNPNYAPPYKSLGIMYAQFGENLKAKIALKKYLTLNPNAGDKAEINTMLSELQ